MLKFRSIKSKISVFYVLVLALILIVYTSVLTLMLRRNLYHEFDRRLKVKTEEIAALFNTFIRSSGVAVTTMQVASHQIILHENLVYGAPTQDPIQRKVLEILDRYELRDDYVTLRNHENQLISASSNISPDLLKQMLAASTSSASAISSFRFAEKPLRMIEELIRLQDGQTYRIQIASSVKHIDMISARVLGLALLLLPVMLFLTAFVGRWLVLSILKPVTVVARTAEGITHEDLSKRVVMGEVDHEMTQLVQAFNHMIARLEQSFKHISEFSSHVAHELKTPLAVIRGESEIALRKERSPEEYREALQANLREARRMIRVVEDILTVSRIDYDPGCMTFKKTDVIPFLSDILEQGKILGEAKSLQFQVLMPAVPHFVSLDEVHGRRLFLNILDNAIKYTPAQGTIRFEVRSVDREEIEVIIQDSGPGIAPQDLPRIFEKFFHRDIAGLPPGNGLGLSMARSIALAHQGDIRVESSLGHGARFIITLPLL